MKKNVINDYTVLELIEKYKDIIGDDIENFLYNAIYYDKYSNKLNNNINIKTDKKSRAKVSYKVFSNAFKENELNTNNGIKRQILTEILIQYQNKIKQRTKREIKRLILEEKSIDIYKFPSRKYKDLFEYEILTEEDPKDIESLYDKIEKNLFKQMIEQIEISDLENLLKPEYKKEILKVIREDAFQEYFLNKGKMSIKEYKELYKDSNNKIAEKELQQIVSEYLKRNFHFVDKEAILLNSAARLMLGIRLIQGEKIDKVFLKDIDENEKQDKINNSILSLKEISKELNKNKYKGKKYTINDEEENEIISVTAEDLKRFLEKCTDSKYISPEQIEQMHEDIKKGILPENDQELEIAEVEKGDVFEIVQTYRKSQNTEEKEKMLKSAKILLDYLKQNKKINNEEIIESYINGDLNIELMNLIDTTELPSEYFNEKLLNIFEKNLFENNEKINAKAKRFGELYAKLRERKQIDTTTDDLVENLSTMFGEEFIPNIMGELYKIGVANIEEALQWLGGEFLNEQYKQENLKPVEIRNLYDSGIIKHDELISMIKSLKDNTEKFMVISSLFPEQEGIDIRQELSERCLDLGEGVKEERGTKRKKRDEISKDYNKYITDPVSRFMLMKLLDKEYSFKMTSDGHAVMYLPNYEKVIIEKMLDKNGRPYYGAATYVLDEDYFESNKNEIIVEDDKIKRSKLSEISSAKSVEKLIHSATGWGKGIKKVFEMDKGTKTPEELNQIEEAIKVVEESRTKVER